jgi:hypothetical protein
MRGFGFSEAEARAFLSREVERTASSTSFYWESEDVEEALEIVLDAVAKLIAENNRRFSRDLEQEFRRSRLST